ncbi:MAG: orotate phosphoribosyltransferase [Bacteroidales bacterium]|nr:orotate phosphoribosyltransferase [Bacteroidales bacterium]MCF8337025.1 orotate phosphoribosyltransferase [Bacteroidales bacterium]
MIYSKEIAREIADSLLQIKAIKLNNANPFTWSSGWKAPIYCDNRKTLSYPVIRNRLKDLFTGLIREKYAPVDVVAGVATGGIALGALVAQELDLPFVYVRNKKKGHGLENQVEGEIFEGQRAVVVEDLVSTGNSSLNAVKALKQEGCRVMGMVAIFTYDFDYAREKFDREACELFALSDYQTAIERALENNYILKKDMDSLAAWRRDPGKWGQNG